VLAELQGRFKMGDVQPDDDRFHQPRKFLVSLFLSARVVIRFTRPMRSADQHRYFGFSARGRFLSVAALI